MDAVMDRFGAKFEENYRFSVIYRSFS